MFALLAALVITSPHACLLPPRAAVAYMTDVNAHYVDLKHPKAASVDDLLYVPAPQWTTVESRLPPEDVVYDVLAEVAGYKIDEVSRALLILVRDPISTHVMVAVFPHPTCANGADTQQMQMHARQAMMDLLRKKRQPPATNHWYMMKRMVETRLQGVWHYGDCSHFGCPELSPVLSVKPWK